MHNHVQQRNDQLQRRLHEDMQLRDLLGRRRHGHLHERLRATMHDDRRTDDLLGLLQRAV
jgi:hypothetical protein